MHEKAILIVIRIDYLQLHKGAIWQSLENIEYHLILC